MITKEIRPTGYEPYETLVFCSNRIIGGGDIFVVGNVVPLLIGRGPAPRIWLQALASPNSQDFVSLVDDSVSRHPAISVLSDGRQVTVKAGGQLLIRIASYSQEMAEVDQLDLRPIGLAVHGDSRMLDVAGLKTVSGTFMHVGTMFQFGPPP